TRSSMVELVDNDVVESPRREPMQVSGERLNTGEQHPGLRLLGAAVVKPQLRVGLDASEYLKRLPQDLLAMGDEQYPAELWPSRIVSREPGLSQASRHHDQT